MRKKLTIEGDQKRFDFDVKFWKKVDHRGDQSQFDFDVKFWEKLDHRGDQTKIDSILTLNFEKKLTIEGTKNDSILTLNFGKKSDHRSRGTIFDFLQNCNIRIRSNLNILRNCSHFPWNITPPKAGKFCQSLAGKSTFSPLRISPR
jgi:hypothetical protein